MSAVRARVLVRGHVQGVWFRGSMEREAAARGVSGWVRNRTDGDVEAEIEGARDQVEALIAWAHHGPRNAEVADVTVTWIAARGDGGRFEIVG